MSAPSSDPSHFETRHATAVAIEGKGVLILGASGRGKSSLALELLSRGAALVSDDLTRIEDGPDGWPVLSTTGRQAGVVEARGVGLLRVPHVPRARVALIVDLDRDETARLPEPQTMVLRGVDIPLVARVDSPAFPASILALVKGGRVV